MSMKMILFVFLFKINNNSQKQNHESCFNYIFMVNSFTFLGETGPCWHMRWDRPLLTSLGETGPLFLTHCKHLFWILSDVCTYLKAVLRCRSCPRVNFFLLGVGAKLVDCHKNSVYTHYSVYRLHGRCVTSRFFSIPKIITFCSWDCLTIAGVSLEAFSSGLSVVGFPGRTRDFSRVNQLRGPIQT